MRYLKTALLIFGITTYAHLSMGADYPGHVAVLKLGANKDTSALAQLRDNYLLRATREERFIIFIASRLASPGKFSTEFVEAFPASRDDKWPKVELYIVDPLIPSGFEFYTAGELAIIAEAGDPIAIRKLVQMATWVDGAWSEIILSGLVQCLIKVPNPTLVELAKLPPATRERILDISFELELLPEDIPKLVTSVHGARRAMPAVAAEVERKALKLGETPK